MVVDVTTMPHTSMIVNVRWHTDPMSPVTTAAAPTMACCSPLVREPLDASSAASVARVFKAIGDPARLRLLSMVAAHEGGEACVCELTEPLGLSQPTVSHHLKVLVDAGLLNREQRGVWAYYSIVPQALDALAAVLDTRQPVTP
jgi:ArsR family transcriptional regulator